MRVDGLIVAANVTIIPTRRKRLVVRWVAAILKPAQLKLSIKETFPVPFLRNQKTTAALPMAGNVPWSEGHQLLGLKRQQQQQPLKQRKWRAAPLSLMTIQVQKELRHAFVARPRRSLKTVCSTLLI